MIKKKKNYCRCLRTEDEVEELQYWCGDATGLRRKIARGEQGVSQRTLRHSKWEEGSEERESVIIGEISNLE